MFQIVPAQYLYMLSSVSLVQGSISAPGSRSELVVFGDGHVCSPVVVLNGTNTAIPGCGSHVFQLSTSSGPHQVFVPMGVFAVLRLNK